MDPKEPKKVAPRRKGTTKVDLMAMLEKQQQDMVRMQVTMEEQARLQTAVIASQLGNAANRGRIAPGQQVVGIVNVSNYSVGLIDATGIVAMEYSLAPSSEHVFVPQSQATIPFVFWQQLRHSKQVRDGFIVRDDSILSQEDYPGPEDKATDLPTEAQFNVIRAPRAWVMSTSEAAMRAAIAKITSTAMLRRLMRTVDQEVFDIGEAQFKGDEERAEKAITALPGVFVLVETLAKARLDALEPMAKDPQFMKTIRR